MLPSISEHSSTEARERLTEPGAVRIRRALLSVSDKTGLVDFAREKEVIVVHDAFGRDKDGRLFRLYSAAPGEKPTATSKATSETPAVSRRRCSGRK